MKVTKHATIRYVGCGFLLVFYSNYVPKMHSFFRFDFEKCSDLIIRVKGHSRSSELTRIDLPPMTSYSRSIVTIGLSRNRSKIYGDISRKSPIFPHLVYLTRLLKGFPLEFGIGATGQKTRMMVLPDGLKVLR